MSPKSISMAIAVMLIAAGSAFGQCVTLPPILTPNISLNTVQHNACNWDVQYNQIPTQIDLLLSGFAGVPAISFLPATLSHNPTVGSTLYLNPGDGLLHVRTAAAADSVIGGGGLNAPTAGAPCIIGANSTVSPSGTTCSSFIVTTLDPTGAADSGPALRAALAAGGPGTYVIPKGTFKISTLVTRTRKQPIIGDSPQGTIFNCPGTTGATCFAIADSTYGPNNYGIFTDKNYTIVGSGKANVASTCVYMGGDPAGVITPTGAFADFVNFTNVIVHDCGTGFLTGNNTYINVWDHFSGWNNHYNFYAPVGIGNSGEREVITNSTIFNSDEGIESTASPLQYWEIDNSSFDFAGLAIHGNQLHVHVKNTHFEAQNGVFIQQDFGNAFIDIDGGEFQYDSGSGTEPAPIVINGIFSTVSLNNLQVNSNHNIPSLINTDNPTHMFVHVRNVSMDNTILAFTNIGPSVRGLIDEMGNNTDQAGKGWAFGCDMTAGEQSSFNVCAPLVLPGTTSGSVTVTAPAAAGTTTFTLPGTNGTTGQVLTRDSSAGTQWSSAPILASIKFVPVHVAALGTCDGTTIDTLKSVDDALTPTYAAVLTGGGGVHTPAYCNGTNWTAH